MVAMVFATSASAKEVTLLMDWFPQGNQSVFWQAMLDNDNHDLKINIKAGGPGVKTANLVAAGQVEFGLNGSDSVMMANSKGAGLVAIFANLDHVPYTLVFHPDQGIKTVQDLDGRRFAVVPGITYWKWIKKEYGVSADEFPLKGDLALFGRSPEMFQQGYSIFLPARLEDKGIANEQINLSITSFANYSGLVSHILNTTIYLFATFFIAWKFSLLAVLGGLGVLIFFRPVGNYIRNISKKKAVKTGVLAQKLIQSIQSHPSIFHFYYCPN